jgi:hypothetical protein
VNAYAYTIGFDKYVDNSTVKVNVQNVYSSHPQGYLQVIATGAMNLNINNMEATAMPDIFLRFGKKAEMPTLTLGAFKTPRLCVQLIGKMQKESTDVNGNVAAQWTETVPLAELKGPLFTLKDTSVFNKLLIYVSNPKDDTQFSDSKYFSLNGKNQVVFTP